MNKLGIIKKIGAFLIILGLIVAPLYVFGQGLGDSDNNLDKVKAGVGGNIEGDLNVVVGNIIKTVLSMVGIIFLILSVYAGYLWMTARGNDETVNKAKEIFKSSIAGLFIIVSAYAITVFVTSRFSN